MDNVYAGLENLWITTPGNAKVVPGGLSRARETDPPLASSAISGTANHNLHALRNV
jgi:hypothetical protein